MFNMVYADKDGHILYQYNGYVPIRDHGDFAYWEGLVPGDTSQNLWTKLTPYEDLPRTLDPPAGWVQNTNNPPWMNTAPPALSPKLYPAYMSPVNMSSSRRAVFDPADEQSQNSPLTSLFRAKLTTRSLLAERTLDPLLAAAAGSSNPLVQQSVALLRVLGSLLQQR